MGILSQVLLPAGLAILAVGWVNSEEPVQTQSFVDFCAYRGVNLTDNHLLGAYCRNDMVAVFGFNWTWIDLDYCLGNNGSELVAYEQGNYSTSCTDCDVEYGGKTLVLTCSCLDADDNYVSSSLDLNTTLYNYNGSVGCFDHLGNKTEFGPKDGN